MSDPRPAEIIKLNDALHRVETQLEAVREWAEEELPRNPDTEWFKGYESALRSLLSLLDPAKQRGE